MSDNLTSEWTCDTASGDEPDTQAASNDWTAVNGPTTGTGLLNGARLFTAGDSEHFTIPSGFLSAMGAWTLSLFFKPTSTALGSDWPRVFDLGTGTNHYLFFTVRSASVGGSRPAIGLKLSGTEYQWGLPAALVADTWYHLLVTAKNGRVAVFLDGECVSGVSGYNAAGSNLAPTLNYIGKSQWADPYYDGLIDQTLLWSRELTPEEAFAVYNGGTPVESGDLDGLTVPSAPTPNANGRLQYQLFSFNETGETLSMFDSDDGIYWTNYAVTYTPSAGTVRDPSGALVGAQWWMVHTRFGTSGGTSFTVAKADDATLESWTEVGTVDCSSVVSTGHCWAPEFARNADGTVYLDSGDGYPRVLVALQATSGGNNAIYEVHPTNATWTTWSTPSAITGTALPANTIDPFPIFMGGSTWKMWCKDEGAGTIKLMTSTTSLTAGWDTIVSDPGSWGGGNEGVSAFKIGSTWLIYADSFSADLGIGYATSGDDFATVSRLSGVSADVLPRHGTVVYAPEIGGVGTGLLTGLKLNRLSLVD